LGLPIFVVEFTMSECSLNVKNVRKRLLLNIPLVGKNSQYMPGVIEYAASRVLDRGDSTRRVTKDLNELHYVEVSVGTVEKWINERGEKGKLSEDFPEEDPPPDFSGFISVDGTFKSVKLKKNDLKTDQ